MFTRPSRLLLGAAGLIILAAPLAVPVHAAPDAAPAQDAPAMPETDPAAKAFLEQTTAAHQALSALSATIHVSETPASTEAAPTVTLAFQKGLGAKAVIATSKGEQARFVSDGKTLSEYDVSTKRYVVQPLPPETSLIGPVFGAAQAILPQMIARPEGLVENFASASLKPTLTTDTLDGTVVDVLTITLPSKPGQPLRSIALSVGHDDHLIRRFVQSVTRTVNGKTETLSRTETATDLTTTPTLTAADFTFVPPAGAKKVASLEPPMHDPSLVPGAKPFAISAKDLSGKPLSLSQYKGKVVLLDFWATWCGPCVGEMPNVIASYKKYHAQGFDVVGVSLDQDKAALTKFIAENKMPWRQVFDGKGWGSGVGARYGVRAIPFGLLIGRDGKIAAVEVRGSALGPAIKAALAQKTATR